MFKSRIHYANALALVRNPPQPGQWIVLGRMLARFYSLTRITFHGVSQ
jgi:hypothetical protein